MSIGASINLYSGEELLEANVRNLREAVAHINVVVQINSNFGEVYNGGYKEAYRLLDMGLIDSLDYYEPNLNRTPKWNERTKRNIGLKRLKTRLVMSLDVDEFYKSEELLKAEESFTGDIGLCQMQTYYHSGDYRLTPPEDYYVSMLMRPGGFEDVAMRYRVDSSRRRSGAVQVFKREDIEMHHFSYVRKDINMKLKNASSKHVYIKKINEIATNYKNWKPGESAIFAGRTVQLERCKNYFNIGAFT